MTAENNMTAAMPVEPAVKPLNGIPATYRHDEGAIARCSHCGRYSLDPATLSDRQPKCECGEKHGWCGSFKKPGPDAKWSGEAPTPPAPAMPVEPAVKPLEWNPFRAETAFGYYYIDDQRDRTAEELKGRPPFLLSGSRVNLARYDTLEAAKAAAQADYEARIRSALATPPAPAALERKFTLGQRVTKTRGSKWTGKIVGFYSTDLTPIGYCVESETERGSVQIYPEAALAAV